MALQQIGVPAFADRQPFCRINLAIVLILRRDSGFSRRFPQPYRGLTPGSPDEAPRSGA
jgi:hypothetical protein